MHSKGSRTKQIHDTAPKFPTSDQSFNPRTMFDALNRFISRLDESQPQSSKNHDGYGFQVLRNKDSNLPIEPWFDFIIGINGRRVVRLHRVLLALAFAVQ